MVSADKKLIERARKQQQVAIARSKASAFDQKQSAFTRRSEELRIRGETETNPFEASQHRTASRVEKANKGTASRNSKYQLNDHSQTFAEEGQALGSRSQFIEASDETGDAKSAKRHRFEEVISATRKTRADFQKEREERHKETDELDAQFAELMPLLPKRDKRQEEVDRFNVTTRPEVQQLLEARSNSRGTKAGRRFVLGDDGQLTQAEGPAGATVDAQQRMEKIAASILEPAKSPFPSTTVVAPVEVDEFDAMLGTFKMELKRAQPVDRILRPEEEAVREITQQLMQMDRERRPEIRSETDRTRTEWVEAGGDSAFRMEDDDEGGLHHPLADHAERSTQAVDEVLAAVESLCNTELPIHVEARSSLLSGQASNLWHSANKQKRHAEDSFKLLLIDAQRRSYKGQALSRFHHVVFYLITRIFPCTDFRHPVVTPLCILLSHLCLESKLRNLAACAATVLYASLLLNTLHQSKRFASECIIAALNVISMQLPKSVLESQNIMFPILERAPEALLQYSKSQEHFSAEPLRLMMLDNEEFDASFERAQSPGMAVDILAAAYRLLLNAMDLFKDSPSFEAIFAMSFLDSLAKALDVSKMHPQIKDLHVKTVDRAATLVASNAMERTPLAMRTFRPRPLRQFEPLMVDDTPTVKKELQLMRQEIRDNHRRVVRTLQAEARVEQHDRELAQAKIDSRKKAKLDSIMAELQQQQKVMKDADALRTKAAGKKKSSKNVVPKSNTHQDTD